MRFLKYFVAWWRTGLGNMNWTAPPLFLIVSTDLVIILPPQINVCFPTLLHFFHADKLTGVNTLSKGWKLNNEINQFLWCLHLKPLCLMTVWARSISFWFKMKLTVMIVKTPFLCASVCIVLADKCWLSCDYHTLISSTLFSILKLIWMNQTQGTCLRYFGHSVLGPCYVKLHCQSCKLQWEVSAPLQQASDTFSTASVPCMCLGRFAIKWTESCSLYCRFHNNFIGFLCS